MIRTILMAVVGVLVAGCSHWPSGGEPLSPRRLGALQDRARPPEALGLKVISRKDAALTLYAPDAQPVAGRAELPFCTRPFQKVSFPVVRLRLNGGLVQALLDTGAAVSLIECGAALRCGLIPLTADTPGQSTRRLVRIQAQGLGGDVDSFLCVARKMTVGDQGLDYGLFGLINRTAGLEGFWWLQGFRVEAVLGADFLRRFSCYQLDYPRERIVLGAVPPALSGSRAIRLPLDRRFPVPVVTVTWENGQGFPAALDSGFDGGLWVPGGLAKQLGFSVPTAATPLWAGHGMGGPTVSTHHAPRTVLLGLLPIFHVPVSTGVAGDREKIMPFALLGNQVLRAFRVTVDNRGGWVYLERP